MAKKSRKGCKTSHCRKFASVAKNCMNLLRAGELPKKGQFASCMRRGFKKR